ncbi:MAG TPA: alpha/beta hydrolase [Stellaceae bacterium]|nr:alpha/beta hydrolase [Stellaceae bacterium]
MLPRLLVTAFIAILATSIGSGGAAAQRFAYDRAPSQFGELRLPPASKGRPVAVLIHGGCWQRSYGLDLMTPLAEDLARQGIAVWNIEYRRLGESGGGYPGTFLDVAAALDTLRGLAPRYGLDLAHVVAVGHSAGGHLALWAAARPRLPKASPLAAPDPLRLSGVVSLSGITDLEAYRNGGPGACGEPGTIDRVTGAAGRAGQNVYADTSPRALLPLGVPQLVVSGERDRIVPTGFARGYARAATAAGDRVELLEIPDADHFALIDPASSAWGAIRAKLLALLR